MPLSAEDFDEYIERLSDSVGDVKRHLRRIPVQKAQLARIPIWCNDVIGSLRDAEDDAEIALALTGFESVIKNLCSQLCAWQTAPQQPNYLEWAILIPSINGCIQSFMGTILLYTSGLPTIFARTRFSKWKAELKRSQDRDLISNQKEFRLLVADSNVGLISALQCTDKRQAYMDLANELGLLSELDSLISMYGIPGAKMAVGSSGSRRLTANRISSVPDSSLLPTSGTSGVISLEADQETKTSPNQARTHQKAQLAVVKKSKFALLPKSLRHLDQFAREAVASQTDQGIPRFHEQVSTGELRFDEVVRECSFSERVNLGLDLCRAVEHIHQQKIVHGDVRGANITLDNTGRAMLTNFGDSVALPAHRTWRAWLPIVRYMAPELITNGEDLDGCDPTKQDIYALITLLYEIFSGETPWAGLDVPGIISSVMRGHRPFQVIPFPLPMVLEQEESLRTLLLRGFQPNPELRPSATACVTVLDDLSHRASLLICDDSTASEVESQSGGIAEAENIPALHHENTQILDITDQVEMTSPVYEPHAHGGFCDVFIGKRGDEKVAMKRLRVAMIGDEAHARTRFMRECQVWKNLKHPHILEFYGMVKRAGLWYMISPFLDNGDAPGWLLSRPEHCFRVALEAARGCLYLHSLSPRPIIHGDLKGANILIKDNGQALIADFGLSKTMNAKTSQGLKDNGTAPYMAPELFNHCMLDTDTEVDFAQAPISKTLQTDVFAFGRTVMELLSGQIPYHEARGISVWCWLLKGKRPARPATPVALRWVTDPVWEFINDEMTNIEPENRPSMFEVVKKLETLQKELRGASEGYHIEDELVSGSEAELQVDVPLLDQGRQTMIGVEDENYADSGIGPPKEHPITFRVPSQKTVKFALEI